MANIKAALARAIIRMLGPMVRMLLRHEISHSEFAELAKRAYVNTAYKYFSIPNRKQTYSRVAVLTGLSRKEVVRLTNAKDDEVPATKGPLNRASRVISGWLRDPDFLDKKNEPKVLELRGEGATFDELVARYSGDITARAILDELIRVGAVTKLENASVKLNHHGYIPSKSDPEILDVVSTHVADLISTIDYNVNRDDQEPRFQRQVTYTEIPESVVKEFQQYSHDKSLALLLDFNKWLADKKKSIKPESNEPTHRVGVGVYFFKNDKDGE